MRDDRVTSYAQLSLRTFALLVALALAAALPAAAPAATFQSTGLYHSYSELAPWAYDLETQNPGLVRVIEFGRTTSDRVLLAVNITADPAADDPTKPEFLFTAGLHAREVAPTDAAMALAENLVGGYQAGDPAYVEMLSQRDVWIIPNMNPDGRVRVEAGYSIMRKNDNLYPTQTFGTNTAGTDLNRNFPHKWYLASRTERSDVYRGPSALSEPESQALWNLLHDQGKFSNLLGSIDYHTGAAIIISPWMSPAEFLTYPLPAEDRLKFDFLANRMSEESGYPHGRLTYDSYGTLPDSLYEEFGTYAITAELYKGPFTDYFTLFNPIDASTRDQIIDNAIASALFMLSDEAFDVPEPSAMALLALGAATLLIRRRRR